MLQQETIAFLSHIHPLDLLPASAIESLCGEAALEYYRRGTQILEQGGEIAEHLFVVKRGTVGLFLTAEDGNELVLDYRGEGEYFGLLSLISGEPPRSDVRAEEDTIILLLPKRSLRAVLDEHPAVADRLLRSYFLDFVDRTYEESRRRCIGLTNGHRVLFATPVGDIVHRDPVTTRDDTSIQAAARLMDEHGISSLVVVDRSGEPVGIMTDRDLRVKAVAEGRDLSRPVRSIMTSPIIEVDAGEPCSEALFKMMRHNIHHIPVTEEGSFRGMVTNHDFMVLQGASPTLLVKKVLETASFEHLGDARERLEQTVAVLSREGARAHHISRVITEVARKLVTRLVALAETELGAPPVPLTVFVTGEAGRSELCLHRAPELALAFEEHGDSDGAASQYARRLQARFERAPLSVSAGVRDRCQSFSAWGHELRLWAEGSGPAPSAGVGILEMSAVFGEVRLLEKTRLELIEAAAAREGFRARLVADTVGKAPPLGFLGKVIVDISGDHRDKLDLYDKGIEPLVDVARILALEKGILVRSTLARLRELRAHHDYVHADEIENALEFLQILRIHQQLAHLEAGEPPDDLVDPATLTNGERKSLKEAFQLIASLHDSLARRYGVKRAGQ